MRFMLRALIVALSFAAVSCTTKDGDGAAKGPGGTLIISIGADPKVLIPPLATSTQSKLIIDMLYEPVAMIGDELNTVGTAGFTGRLADRWEWSRDSTSIAFHLNPKARWHDGQPVVAGDVKFSFDVYKNPATRANGAQSLASIDSVSVRDSSTFVVWYHERSPEQFFSFVYNVTPFPQHVYGKDPVDKLAASPVARTPVGSGRFRFVKWEAGSLVELVADTTSWRGRPSLDRLIFSVTPEQTARSAKVLAGESDFIEMLRGDAVQQAAKSTVVVPVNYRSLSYAAMLFRLRDTDGKRPHPIFGSRDVRRAIAMAIDRPTLVRNILDTLGAPGIGPITRALGVAGDSDRQAAYDVDGARKLLDAAGWRDTNGDSVRDRAGKPLAFDLLVQASNVPQNRAALIMQDQLLKVGVKVAIKPIEYTVLVQHFMTKEFDALLIGFQNDPSPSDIRNNWTTQASRAGGGFNKSSYENPAFDATLDSAVSAFDPATSAELYKRAVAIILADVPAIWLYEPRGVGAVHRRVQTVGLRPDFWWAHLDEWTIDPAKMIDRDRIGLRVATR